MTLPSRVIAASADPEESAAQLIFYTRHQLPVLATRSTAEARRHGRGFIFKTLAALAGTIVLYYKEVGDRPLAVHGFEPGSAEHFAYGYVGALYDGREDLCEQYLAHFWGSCENEVERAILLMADAASQCLNITELIKACEASIS